jgi:methyl-accepting chemotaxis protein
VALHKLSIGRKLGLAFATLILVTTVVGAAIWSKTSFVQASAGWSTHTHRVLAGAGEMMAAMVDQETGLRAFLLAGEDRFLEPYRNGGAAFREAYALVRRLTADNATQQQRLTEIERLAQSWRNDHAEQAIALMRDPARREQARAKEINGDGKAAMDSIRRLMAEFEQMERDLLLQRDAAQQEAFSATYLLLGGGAALLLVSSLVLWLVLNRASRCRWSR